MKISEISGSVNVKAGKPKSKKSNKKKTVIITVIVIVSVLAIIAVILYVRYWMYCLKMYDQYIKPIENNERLSFNGDTEHGKIYDHFSDDLTYVFSTTFQDLPYSDDVSIISIQMVDGTGYDENDDLITDHSINLTYSLDFDGTVHYDVYITEYGTGEKKDKNRYSQIWFTPDMEYIEGYCIDDINGKDYKNTDEVREIFKKYKSETKEHLEMLWDFFGKENFKSQDKIVRLMKDGEK